MLHKIVICFICFVTYRALPVSAAEFIPLGFPVSRLLDLDSVAVSEDGRVVAGVSGDRELIKWTRDAAAEVITDGVFGVDLSGDGTTIVTGRRIEDSWAEEPLRITDSGIEVLTTGSDIRSAVARTVSNDGAVVFGYVHSSDSTYSLVRWSNDQLSTLSTNPFPPISNIPYEASANGEVVVSMGASNGGGDRWSADDGLQSLPGLEDDLEHHRAYGVSADGRWSVGFHFLTGFNDHTKSRGLIWDGVSSPEQIVPSNDSWGSVGMDVTSDAETIVGALFLSDDARERRAGLWRNAWGAMKPLQEVLVDKYGLDEDLEGWQLASVFDLTDDGRYMVGHAINPDGLDEAFLVDLGLAGDFDGDEVLDIRDLDALSATIRSGEENLKFDLDYSNAVDLLDQQYWVKELKGTFFGDANLDQRVDFADFLSLSNKFGQDGGWADGDFTGDGQVLFADFLMLSENFGKAAASSELAASVPEPNASLLLSLGLFMGLGRRRTRSNDSH